eukprot:gene15461-18344_t
MATFSYIAKRNLLQTKLLLKKNVVVAIRAWTSTLIELSSPIFFMIILLVIAKAPSPLSALQRPAETYHGSLPICKPYAENRCFTLVYAPSNITVINDLMAILAETNDPVLQVSNDTMGIGNILPMDSIDDVMEFVKAHPNVTMGGLAFYGMPANFPNAAPASASTFDIPELISYDVLWNSTCPNLFNPESCTNWAVPINMAVQRAINVMMSRASNLTSVPSLTLKTSYYPMYDPASNSVVTYGCLFFFCGTMISFIFMMYKIAFEKEKKLKQGMIMMGLSGSVYWVSWFITCFVLNFILTLVTIGVGAACQFEFFLSTNFFVNFLTFFLFAISMNQVAFFILTFIHTTKAAIGIGMTIFIVGSILQLNFSTMGAMIFQILYQTNSTWAKVARTVLYILPMSHFSKAITDINTVTATSKYTDLKFTWSDLYLNLNTAPDVNIPETYMSLVNMVILAIAYTILAWYFEHVIPGNDGNSYPPWFFLLPSYWGFTPMTPHHIPIPAFEDEDVREAITRAHNDNNKSPVVLKGLSKTYHNLFNSKKDVKAVRYMSLSIDEGNILCLLGHNGAGKTTTIGILTGLISPSSGDAMIYGRSIVSEMAEVRKMTSVCPQHDILWNELTAREHLQLFAELKGIPIEQRQESIDNALESVKLTKVANNQITTYSGGMKRRLSVAISTIGDPKIIFMDEPTTGMDPQSRRHIWNLIKTIKKDRVIILTTHLMEEADILGDRIVIMSHGTMACNGNSLQLKHRFGEGYSINIIAKTPEDIPQIKAFIAKMLPESKLLNEAADFMNFGFPLNTNPKLLISFFQSLEKISNEKETSYIRDWGVSHTTLDDVFLQVTKLKQQ